MQIVIKKDFKETTFNRIASGTVFRTPNDSETFYLKTKCSGHDEAINLYDGSYNKFCGENKVIPYEDAELVIK